VRILGYWRAKVESEKMREPIEQPWAAGIAGMTGAQTINKK
jgi:hypothetical protein